MKRSAIARRNALAGLTALLMAAAGGHARPGTSDDPPGRVTVEFGDLVDPSLVGHSGRTAVETLQLLQLFSSMEGAPEEALTAMQSDLEPICEPLAFVLNDALAVFEPKSLRLDLVDVATWLPDGAAEPAWADLVRTRRFHLLTDGGSYVRAFLPGLDAAGAYDAAYPVLRHALGWIDRATPELEGLKVDVYAYAPDLRHAAFDLSLEPVHRAIVGAGDAPPGTNSLDLARLSKFFADGYRLNGAVIDGQGQLVLIGDNAGGEPTLDGVRISLSDFAVAYRAVAHSGLSEPYMSLDPSGNVAVAQVNFGGRLQDTLIGSVALRCDVRFKTISTGHDADLGERLDDVVRQEIPDFVTRQERKFRTDGWEKIESESTRFWFYPDSVNAVADSKGVLFKECRFTAAAEREEAYDSDGKPIAADTPPWTSGAIAHFNSNYERFSQLFPEIRELDDVARLLAAATWVHDAARAGVLKVDIDSVLDVELPACRTPRSRPQLLLQYLVETSTTPPTSRVLDMTHIALAHGSDGDGSPLDAEWLAMEMAIATREALPEGELSDSVTGMSVITGGLDLNLAPRLARAAGAGGKDAELLENARV